MSLTMQSIQLATDQHSSKAFTMPAEHVYPFIIHRSVEETMEKKNGERSRYSKKHCVSHLLTGALLGVFGSYKGASRVVDVLKEEPLWLMPTIELFKHHPDWDRVATKVRELKRTYGLF
jgi:hypothetical protein